MSKLFGGWVAGWTAAFHGAARAMPQLVNPATTASWLRTINGRRRPTWSTPNEIVFEGPVARLRDFSSRLRGGRVPTLVLPPQAGHDSCIVDYSPTQSQMRTILDSGLEQAYALDWLGATHETADASIDEYLDVVDQAVERCGGRVNLIGDCQGGWLATIYAALAPEHVNTLTIAGAPIDFHAGESVIHETVRHLTAGGDMRFYEALVASGGGVFKGEHMLSGFILINPADEISRQLDLLVHLGDDSYVERYSYFEDWFKHTQDIPGEFYLWIVRNLFRDNLLIAGELEIGGRRIDLNKLTMPVNLLGGEKDHITPPDQVFALAEATSTPADLIRRGITSGGHLGLFMGREALREYWPPMLESVLEHS
jgi:poly(3-hydroxybutyrate) depolymerase